MNAAQGERVTMTFLFTDIEGSTRLWEQYPDTAMATIGRHDRIIEAAVERHGGSVFHRAGDGMIARFDGTSPAVVAAIDAQRAIGAADWTGADPIRVRMGIHTGPVVIGADGPYGWALNLGARLADVGHGGQVLLSEAAHRSLLEDPLADVEVRDVGVHRLRDIPRPTSVFQLLAPGLESEFPPPRNTVTPLRRLPRPDAPLVGRESDVAAIGELIESRRLVTMAGTSGIGKTRIAVEVAHRLAEDRDMGVMWCDLTGVQPDAVVAAVTTLHAITLRPGRTLPESLVDWLADRRLLLVLDRCDECQPGVVDLIDAVLAGAPGVSVLCTSQRVLGFPGEVVHRVAPLSPEDALALFVDRAQTAGAADIDVPTAERLCEQLDGMPFGIEIAAAGAATYSVAELLETMRAGGLPVGARQRELARSVQHAVEFGVSSLPDEVSAALVSATVFVGQFDREMFAAVCTPGASAASVAATLADLVNSSLVQREPAGDRATFRLLDPVRSFVEGVGGDDVVAEAGDRLRDYLLESTDQVALGLRGREELLWLKRWERQFETVRAVFDRALELGDIDTAARLSSRQWEWAFFRFNSEYFDWGARLIGQVDKNDPRLSVAHGVVALGCWFRDEIGPAFDHADESIRLEREHGGEFSLPARLAMINATVFSGADAPPPDVFAAAAEYQLRRPERYYHMNVEASHTVMATWFGQHELAERHGIDALRLARESGNPSSIAYALWVLGQAIEHDDPERGENMLDDALQQARDVDNRWIVSLAQLSLASLRRRTLGPAEAALLLHDLLGQLSRAGHRSLLWSAVRLSALVLGDVGDHELAVQLGSAVAAAHLAWPALPVDAKAIEQQRSSIEAEHDPVWLRRAALIASTWDTEAAVTAARGGLGAVLEAA